VPDEHDIRMQANAGVYEQNVWSKRGALWRTYDGLILAPTALLRLLILNAHGFDHCARGEVIRRIRKHGIW